MDVNVNDEKYLQDWCISRGYVNLSPYAGAGGQRQRSGQEDEVGEASGDAYDDDYSDADYENY